MATFTRPTDLNDRQAFYELGDKYEKAFVKKMRKKNYDVQINPDKETNKTAIDLLWDGKLVELKTRRTPFFKSGNYQIDPNHAVTINGKDIDNYAETPTLEVVFWVKWPAQTKYGVTVKAVNGVWFNSGDPAAGTNDIMTLTNSSPDPYQVFLGFNSSSAYTADVNFGNGYFGTTAVSSSESDDNGEGSFEYDVPAGFYALCTNNLGSES